VLTFLFIIIMGGITYYGLGWIKTVAGKATIYIVCVLLFAAYLLLLKFACRVPELDTTTEIDELPELGPTAQAGYYFPAAHRGADVVPGGGTAFAGPVGLLGHGAVDVYRAHPAPPQRHLSQNEGTTLASSRIRRPHQRVCQRRPQHDRHRCGHIGRRHRRGHRDPDRYRPGDDRICRVHLRRQPHPDPALSRR
jgi:hypothetical protein